jgi:hypothetical protein
VPTTTSTVPTTTTTAGSASTTTCGVGQLVLSVVGSNGAAGTIETTFALKHPSGSPCTLGGYPGALMLDSSGKPITTLVVRGGGYAFTNMPATKVSLSAGDSAYFNLGYSDVPTGNASSCPSSAQLEVTPPNDTSQLVVSFNATVCNNGTLTVSPVFAAGSAQSQTTAPVQG